MDNWWLWSLIGLALLLVLGLGIWLGIKFDRWQFAKGVKAWNEIEEKRMKE